ncbi:MAG: DUF3887 domain-containing protein [Cytophagaceae bacterium]|nr:DUF3887 domain-containing protein [Cytophagaceae bacterium]
MKKTALFIFLLFLSLSAFSQENTLISLAFLNYLKKAKYDEAYPYFDQSIADKVTVQTLEDLWNNTQAKLGMFLTAQGSTNELKDSTETVIVKSKFESIDLDIKFVFNSKHKIIGFFFLPAKETIAPYLEPSYEDKSLYKEQAVSIKTKDNLKLPASFVVPKQKKKFPIVIFIHGSGPSDKDETVGPTKIFRDMAVGLAKQGIASLRFDKRTKVNPEQFITNNNFTADDEVINDAIDALKFAKKLEGVDSNSIYIIGHSLGGMLAPKINERYPALRGIILMAANARPLQDLIVEQVTYINSLDGLTDNETLQISQLTAQLEITKDASKIISHTVLGLPASYWIDLNNYNQVKVAEKLTNKMLVLQGERDYQVTMEDFKIWKESLAMKENVSVKSYPALNHLFIEGIGKSIPAEYKKAGNVPEYVIIDIADFINK